MRLLSIFIVAAVVAAIGFSSEDGAASSIPRPMMQDSLTTAFGQDAWSTEILAWDFNQDLINNFNNMPALIGGWENFPNVDNPNLPATEGVEKDSWQTCLSLCDVYTPARSITAATGSWTLPDVGHCITDGSKSCVLVVVNVGNSPVNFAFTQWVGGINSINRYRNGDPVVLPRTTAGVAGYFSSLLLNEQTDLAEPGRTAYINPCSADGCSEVHVTVLVVDPRITIKTSTVARR